MSEPLFSELPKWLRPYVLQIALSILPIIFYVVVNRILVPILARNARIDKFTHRTNIPGRNTIRWITGLIALAVLLAIWGVDFSGVWMISTTILTLLGVALFANWSILSNVTAFFVLNIVGQFHKGDYLRVMEMDNSIEGVVEQINLFNTLIITQEGDLILYPNNHLLARVIFVNPKNRYTSIVKYAPNVNQSSDV